MKRKNLMIYLCFFILALSQTRSANSLNISIEEQSIAISDEVELEDTEAYVTAITDSGPGEGNGDGEESFDIDSTSVSFRNQGCFVVKICKNVNVPRVGLRNLCRTEILCE